MSMNVICKRSRLYITKEDPFPPFDSIQTPIRDIFHLKTRRNVNKNNKIGDSGLVSNRDFAHLSAGK